MTALLNVAMLRAAAMETGITDITQKGRQLLFSFDTRIDPSGAAGGVHHGGATAAACS